MLTLGKGDVIDVCLNAHIHTRAMAKEGHEVSFGSSVDRAKYNGEGVEVN